MCPFICEIEWKSMLFLSNVTKVCRRNAMHDIPQQCISYQLRILEGNVFQRKRTFCWNDSDVSRPTGFNKQNSIFIFPFGNVLYTNIFTIFYPIARIIWAHRYNLCSLHVTFNRSIYCFISSNNAQYVFLTIFAIFVLWSLLNVSIYLYHSKGVPESYIAKLTYFLYY
jgi:hypothetical protein